MLAAASLAHSGLWFLGPLGIFLAAIGPPAIVGLVGWLKSRHSDNGA